MELWEKEQLIEKFPQLKDKLKGNTFSPRRYWYDDNVPMASKAAVIEVYYKKRAGGKVTLQYIKYVGNELLYASEHNREQAANGFYSHGRYPYVFDALFPIEGSPCGYGFVDVGKNPQTSIDLLKTAFIKNAMVGAMPRYFKRQNGNVNEEEFLDNLMEYAARGTITQRAQLSPADYGNIMSGAIAETLNADDSWGNRVLEKLSPVFGDIGVGDLYQVGYSALQSMTYL